MKILVCLQQVPETTKVEIYDQTGVLKRDGVDSKMNSYDLYALETSLRIKEQMGGKVTVLTMGPPQAKAVIKEAYMMGADEGYLISDRSFAGSDVLATAYTIAQAIKVIGEQDLIICGKQTTDGDTAQVGPAMAELLGIPHVAWVNLIKDITAEAITVSQDMANSVETVEITFPCLITVEKDIYQPRLPSYRKKLLTEDRPIKVLSLKDFLDQDESHYGLKGSATQVERIFPPDNEVEQEVWVGEGVDLASRIADKLKELRFI